MLVKTCLVENFLDFNESVTIVWLQGALGRHHHPDRGNNFIASVEKPMSMNPGRETMNNTEEEAGKNNYSSFAYTTIQCRCGSAVTI